MITLPGQDNFVLDEYPLYNLNRTSSTYVDEMNSALKQIGMNQAQWRVLGILGDKNPSTVTDIARRSVLKMSTLTRMLDRMNDEKLITRKLWEKDKRIVHVHITKTGREYLAKAVQVGARIYERAFDGISQEDALHLMETLIKMRENLNRSPYSPSGA
ncbi:MAG: MarR family transcriptional regulator [Kordiimonadaceae bacterium]|nr:MarR family transcriptional regulator [Kordiimonadaceae bacterium]